MILKIDWSMHFQGILDFPYLIWQYSQLKDHPQNYCNVRFTLKILLHTCRCQIFTNVPTSELSWSGQWSILKNCSLTSWNLGMMWPRQTYTRMSTTCSHCLLPWGHLTGPNQFHVTIVGENKRTEDLITQEYHLNSMDYNCTIGWIQLTVVAWDRRIFWTVGFSCWTWTVDFPLFF